MVMLLLMTRLTQRIRCTWENTLLCELRVNRVFRSPKVVLVRGLDGLLLSSDSRFGILILVVLNA